MSRAFHTLVTTRQGGVSRPPFDTFNLGFGVPDDPEAVRANRSRLAGMIGLRPGDVAWMHQVHGTNVTAVDSAPATAVPDTDAMVTAHRGLALAVLVADCVPVLLGDGDGTVIGAAHAGRRGAAGGILPATMEAMVRLGGAIERFQVHLGPAICGACYEVPADMRDEVDATLPGSACRTSDGTPGLDLRAGLAAQLDSLGVALITVDPRCTKEDPQLFSHRRSAPSGRLAAVVWLD